METNSKSNKEVTIADVIVNPNKIQPMLVDFQNIPIKDSVEDLKYNLFKNKRNETLLGISNDRMVYKGEKVDVEKELISTMIGVYNKKTGQVRLIDCEQWVVRPVLDKVVEVRTDFDEGAINKVNKHFGSKKVKRRTEQYEKSQVNIESVKVQLESVIASMKVDQSGMSVGASDEFTSKSVPPCNREATTVFDVYNLYHILPKDIMKTLYESIENVVQNRFPNSDSFFSHLLNVVEKGSKLNKKVSILIYLRALCKWLELPVKDARKIDFVKNKLDLTNETASHLIENYTIASQTGRLRPPMCRDKVVIHAMILTLMVNNYSIDLEFFSKAIKIRIGIKKLIEFAKLLCLTSEKNQKNNFALKLPLPLPPSTTLTKKSKRK